MIIQLLEEQESNAVKGIFGSIIIDITIILTHA